MTQQEAIAKARQIASESGWAWVDPPRAQLRKGWFGTGSRWEIHSNANGLGAIVRIELDDRTGEVLHKGYVKR
ncbi:MAG TPA: hypothetical protein VHZ07_17470 [Bryobacteraceae bacterium]|jgi:hypothetical protein|nr:hypothetical protein [Bryobacteraceae bacterium]